MGTNYTKPHKAEPLPDNKNICACGLNVTDIIRHPPERVIDKMNDPVNNPSHYTTGKIECIDAIESALTPEEFRGFLKGNSLKYLWREGRKGSALEDVEKSRWYSERLRVLRRLEAEGPPTAQP